MKGEIGKCQKKLQNGKPPPSPPNGKCIFALIFGATGGCQQNVYGIVDIFGKDYV